VGIEAAREELLGADPNRKKVMVILSDGVPVEDPLSADNQATISKDAGIAIYMIAYGTNQQGQDQLRSWASDPKNTHAFVAPDPDDIESVFGQLGQILGGKGCFFRGSLRDLLSELDSGLGIPLDGNRDTVFDEIKEDPDSEARDDFSPSTNTFIGFAWYLPVDHANEIQSDSVSFDLGLYTEQSRHNDGSGMAGNDG
jgi:Ca-activated chloride channel family protein